MNGPGPNGGSGDWVLPWIVLSIGVGIWAFLTIAWFGATLGVAVTGGGWHLPPYGFLTLFHFLGSGPRRLWPHGSAAGAWAGIVVAEIAAIAGVVASIMRGHTFLQRRGWVGMRTGLAAGADMTDLARDGQAETVVRLRRSLAPSPDSSPDGAPNGQPLAGPTWGIGDPSDARLPAPSQDKPLPPLPGTPRLEDDRRDGRDGPGGWR